MNTKLSYLPLLLAFLGCSGNHNQNLENPNIVIVLTDDLGYGDVSELNPESKIQTPNIDALAGEGVWFTDAHAAASVCSPSRYALLTGRYAWRGKLKSGIVLPYDEPVIEKGRVCLPQMLKEKGYNTVCIGKWHLGFLWPWKDGIMPPAQDRHTGLKNDMFDWSKPIGGGPLAIGFDHYFGDGVPNFPPYAFIEDSFLTCNPVDIDPSKFEFIGPTGYFHGAGPGQEGWRLENVMPSLTQKAVWYIENNCKKKEPFFLYFATTSPHTPVVPLPKFQGKSKDGYRGDYVVQTDDAIGQVIRALKENNCFDNTLLIVTSDNGPDTYTIEEIRKYNHFAAGPYRGVKFDTWEGGHREVFVASWPAGGIVGGKKNNSLISLTDVFATIAGIVGYELPENCAEDGYDILPSLKSLKPIRKEMVYQNAKGNLGLRQDNWVYLEGSGGNKKPDWYNKIFDIQSPDSTIQLFNLSKDPGQKINIEENYAEKVRKMADRLTEIKKNGKSR